MGISAGSAHAVRVQGPPMALRRLPGDPGRLAASPNLPAPRNHAPGSRCRRHDIARPPCGGTWCSSLRATPQGVRKGPGQALAGRLSPGGSGRKGGTAGAKLKPPDLRSHPSTSIPHSIHLHLIVGTSGWVRSKPSDRGDQRARRSEGYGGAHGAGRHSAAAAGGAGGAGHRGKGEERHVPGTGLHPRFCAWGWGPAPPATAWRPRHRL